VNEWQATISNRARQAVEDNQVYPPTDLEILKEEDIINLAKDNLLHYSVLEVKNISGPKFKNSPLFIATKSRQ